jgi:hypothetical protein
MVRTIRNKRHWTSLIATHKKLPTPEWIRPLESKTTATGKRLYEVSPGLWYPSITTVIGAEPEKAAALDAWRESYGRDRAKARTEKAAARGTTVHDYLDSWINGEDIELNPDEHDIIVRAPFNQLRKEFARNVDVVIANEVPLYSETLRTAGRVDVVGNWKGKPAIIDFKTADKRRTEEFIEGYFLQTTAYALCWYEMSGELIEDIVVMIGNENLFKPQVFHKTIYPYINRVQQVFEDYHTRNAKK